MLKFSLRLMLLLVIIFFFLGLVYFLHQQLTVLPWPIIQHHHMINLALVGTLLILLSLLYSLRKRRRVRWGSIRLWLTFHVIISSLGLLLVLVHSGYTFTAWEPGLTMLLMALSGISGLFGWHLYLLKVKPYLDELDSLYQQEEYFWNTAGSLAYRFWFLVHLYSSLFALAFAAVHALSLLAFRGAH